MTTEAFLSGLEAHRTDKENKQKKKKRVAPEPAAGDVENIPVIDRLDTDAALENNLEATMMMDAQATRKYRRSDDVEKLPEPAIDEEGTATESVRAQTEAVLTTAVPVVRFNTNQTNVPAPRRTATMATVAERNDEEVPSIRSKELMNLASYFNQVNQNAAKKMWCTCACPIAMYDEKTNKCAKPFNHGSFTGCGNDSDCPYNQWFHDECIRKIVGAKTLRAIRQSGVCPFCYYQSVMMHNSSDQNWTRN